MSSRKTSASVLIGIGIGFGLVALGYLLFSVYYVLGCGALTFGAGSFLTGATNNFSDQSRRGRNLSYLAVVLIMIAAFLFCFHFYNAANK